MWPFNKKKNKREILEECSSQELMDELVSKTEGRVELFTGDLVSLINRMDFLNTYVHGCTPYQIKDSIKRTLHLGDMNDAMEGLGSAVIGETTPFREQCIVIGGTKWRQVLLQNGRMAHKGDVDSKGPEVAPAVLH